MGTDHNHLISKALYEHLPQQRRLPTDIQSEILHFSKLKTKRREGYIQEIFNKNILLKDIHDTSSDSKSADENETSLQASIEKLQKTYGNDCHTLSDEENNCKALFFQTKVMKRHMSAYPEFICINATYKLLDIRTPVLIIINEDANGLPEIVSVGLLVEENAESLQWFFSKFKDNNPKWTEVKSIMADRNLNERWLLIKEHFPNAHIAVRIFHAMRSFNREISTVKLGITAAQRQTVLEIMQKMVYSKNADAYYTLYGDLFKKFPLSVVEYFDKNWHEIRDEWTCGPNFQQANFLKTINNMLESFNKTLVGRFSSLSNFIDDFFKVILILNDEQDHKAANSIHKLPINSHEKGSVLYSYHQLLTSYAFEFVEKEYIARKNTPQRKYETTFQSCNCDSRTSMLLPCCHILKKREEHGMDMFDEHLCNERWTRKHYFSNQRIFLTNFVNVPDTSSPSTSDGSTTTVTKPNMKPNQHQKSSKAWKVLKSLAGLVSEADDARYHMRLGQLMQLKTAWESDEDIVLIKLKSGDTDEDLLKTEENKGNEISIKLEEENHIFTAVAQDDDENHVPEAVQYESGMSDSTLDDLPTIYSNQNSYIKLEENHIFTAVAHNDDDNHIPESVQFESELDSTPDDLPTIYSNQNSYIKQEEGIESGMLDSTVDHLPSIFSNDYPFQKVEVNEVKIEENNISLSSSNPIDSNRGDMKLPTRPTAKKSRERPEGRTSIVTELSAKRKKIK